MADREIILNRREVVARILESRGAALVIPGLGSTTWDVAAAGDSPLDFYLWGGMGGATMIGLGLALAQPQRRVLVITGDGEMLMGLGSLATVAVQAPANLSVVVIDNQRYGETGQQPTHTQFGVDLAGVAAAVGFREAETLYTMDALEPWIPRLYGAPHPVFACLKVKPGSLPLVLPERHGPVIKDRFRQALLG